MNLRFITVIALCALALASCKDTAGGGNKTTTGTGGSGSTPPPDPKSLAEAPAAVATDTIPIRTAEGGLTRYGLASGKLVFEYTGDVTGKRTIQFTDWGMYERTEDSAFCSRSKNPMLNRNTVTINTPDWFMHAATKDSSYQKVKNEIDERFTHDDSLKKKSFGIAILENGPFKKRLPDTTINGYRCRVYVTEQQQLSTTNYIWRGIIIREHVHLKQDSIDFWVSAVSIEPNVSVSKDLFSFPAGYREMAAPVNSDPMGAPAPGGGPEGGSVRGPATPPNGQMAPPPNGQMAPPPNGQMAPPPNGQMAPQGAPPQAPKN